MANQYLDRIYQKKYLGIDFKPDWRDYIYSLGIKKNKDAIKIMVYPGVMNVAYYRVFAPFMELAKSPAFDVRVSNVLTQQDDVNWADVVYFDRCADKNIIAEARRAKKLGKKIMYDTDDLMHGLPNTHPQKRNIENGRYLQDMDELCELCDAVTVSTEFLKKIYAARYSAPVVVLPNCIRIDDYEVAPAYRLKDKLVIGWAGSSTHYEDIKSITPALIRIFKRHPEATLMTLNYSGVEQLPYRDAFEGIPSDRRIPIQGTEPHLVAAYKRIIDIGLAPLLDNDFNRSKSNVKVLEYSMCNALTVASDLEPYQPDREDIWLAGSNPSEWEEKIEEVIGLTEEQRLKKEFDTKQNIIAKYDIHRNVGLWMKLLEDLVR